MQFGVLSYVPLSQFIVAIVVAPPSMTYPVLHVMFADVPSTISPVGTTNPSATVCAVQSEKIYSDIGTFPMS